MSIITEKKENITKQDIDSLEKELDSLQWVNKEIMELTNRYLSFRLQLIAIAGATFSIYVALGSQTDTQIGFIKYGFIMLAVSLLSGFMSIAFSLLSRASIVWYALFDFDMSMRNKGGDTKKLLKSTRLKNGLVSCDEDKNTELGLKLMRGFLTSISGQGALLLGIGQVAMFLVATVFLILGLIFV